MQKVGVIYHPKLEAARAAAGELRAAIEAHGPDVWVGSAWDEGATHAHGPETDLLICIGGDGTVLRGARAILPREPLILGVNMGRLGFLSELDLPTTLRRLPDILERRGRVERRAMLRATTASREGHVFHALNDVVIGRSTLGRTVQLSIHLDGARMAEYRCDGVILATATGSTAYSLSVGGPIMNPESRDLLLTPLAPHLMPCNAIVLPRHSTVEVRLAAGQMAAFSVDGESSLDLSLGDTVHVTAGAHVARFLRFADPTEFYSRVARRLNWLRDEGAPPLPPPPVPEPQLEETAPTA